MPSDQASSTSEQSPPASPPAQNQQQVGPTVEQGPSLEGLSDFSRLIEYVRTKFISEEDFGSRTTNEARVSCCLEKDQVREGFEKYEEAFSRRRSLESVKSASLARTLRTRGNKLFKARKYDDALEAFSSAVVTAPFGRRGNKTTATQIPTSTSEDESKISKKNVSPASNGDVNTNKEGDKEGNEEDDEEGSSRELALAFANRSATLFSLKYFEESFADASLALQFDYPSSQRHTLLLRQSLCLKALGRHEEAKELLQSTLDAIDEDSTTVTTSTSDETSDASVENGDSGDQGKKKEDFKSFVKSTFDKFTPPPDASDEEISPGSHSKSPPKHVKPVEKHGSRLKSASDWVKLCIDETHGRHLKASRAVGRDEVALTEKPFAAALNYQFFESFCHHCCQDLRNRLYPCPDCSTVRYCSKECQEESWKSYHGVECPYLPVLLSMGVLRLSLRILVVAGVETCLAVHEEASKVVGGQNKISTMKEYCGTGDYKSVYGLIDHSKDLAYLVSSRQSLAAAFMLYLVSSKMNLISSSHPSYFKVGALLLKHIHQISVNSIVIFHQPIISGPHDINGIDVKSQVIGTAIYPTLSLMNHSCVPNTENFFVGSTLYVKTRTSLPQSTELTVSYGPLFKKMSRTERMETLQTQYYFKCECPACSDTTLIPEELSKPEEHPVLTECFLCPECNGPLLINTVNICSNADESPVTICEGKCLKCGITTSDVNTLVERIDSAKKVTNLCKALTQFGRRAEAHKSYVKQLNALSKICYPTNRFILSIMTDLLSLSLSLEKIEEARKYCEDITHVKKLTFGENSYEYRQGILQLLNIRWSQQRKIDEQNAVAASARTSSMNKKIIQRLIVESNEAINQAMALVEKNKIDGDLVALDSALVSFLKELVELERNLKN